MGIPNSVKDADLEKTVINILNQIDVAVDQRDIVAVHRLKGNNQRFPSTIVRFLNRKHAYRAKSNKKKLANRDIIFKGLFIVENLCPVYIQFKYLFA